MKENRGSLIFPLASCGNLCMKEGHRKCAARQEAQMVKRTEFGITMHDGREDRSDPKRSHKAKARDMARRAAARERRTGWGER